MIAPGDQSGAEGDAVALQIQASDSTGGTLTYSAAGLPDGLNISPTTGLITGTIAAGASAGSPFVVSVTATDGAYSVSQTFSWAVAATSQAPASQAQDTVFASFAATAANGLAGLLVLLEQRQRPADHVIDGGCRLEARPPPWEKPHAGNPVCSSRVTANGKTADGRHRLNNGALYTVRGFTAAGDVVVDNGWVIGRDFGHIAYGYVVTSHAAQGKTVDKVLIGQSQQSLPASDRQQLYVSSRGPGAGGDFHRRQGGAARGGGARPRAADGDGSVPAEQAAGPGAAQAAFVVPAAVGEPTATAREGRPRSCTIKKEATYER